MLGPLPTFHRLAVAITALVAATSLGLLAGAAPSVPVVTSTATTAAVLAGAFVAWLLVGAAPASAAHKDR